jgi:hypothetical protein
MDGSESKLNSVVRWAIPMDDHSSSAHLHVEPMDASPGAQVDSLLDDLLDRFIQCAAWVFDEHGLLLRVSLADGQQHAAVRLPWQTRLVQIDLRRSGVDSAPLPLGRFSRARRRCPIIEVAQPLSQPALTYPWAPGFLHRLKSQNRLDVATSPQDLADTAPRRPAAGGGGIERSFNHAVFCKGTLPVTDSPSFRIVGALGNLVKLNFSHTFPRLFDPSRLAKISSTTDRAARIVSFPLPGVEEATVPSGVR